MVLLVCCLCHRTPIWITTSVIDKENDFNKPLSLLCRYLLYGHGATLGTCTFQKEDLHRSHCAGWTVSLVSFMVGINVLTQIASQAHQRDLKTPNKMKMMGFFENDCKENSTRDL